MEVLQELLANQVLCAAVVAWAIAQVTKTIINALLSRSFSPERLIGSGGMPSSHTSAIMAMSTGVGLTMGFSTPTYALAAIISGVVMYDASGVRRNVGLQAEVINNILREVFEEKHFGEEQLKELVGHKPTEVIVGAILGIVVANVMIG